MKLSYLVKGLPGHPIHPPLTDATIGIYTGATIFGALSALGLSERNTATAWWLALIVGLAATGPTAATGFIDWLGITWGSSLWRTASVHLLAMVTATVFFLLAAVFGHGGYVAGSRVLGSRRLLLRGRHSRGRAARRLLVHGMRVLNLVEEPARSATAGVPPPKKEAATAEHSAPG